ncbi:MAG: tyrosine-type recombinase/integrase [Wujia sp.]
MYLRKRQRAKGYIYEIIVDHSDVNGKRIRKSKALPLGTKKVEAEKIARRMELEIEMGAYIDREPITLNAYFEEKYLGDYVVVAGLSPTTVKNYKQMFNVKGGIGDYLGAEYVHNITADKLQTYVRLQMTKENRSPKTIKNHMGLIRNILHRAMIDRYMTRQENPVTYVVMPTWEKKETQAYTLAQVKTMMQRAEEAKDLFMLAVIGICCLGGGLRRSELAGLKSSRCYVEKNIENKAIDVCESVVQVEGGQENRRCKTKSSIRTVPIGDTLADIICRVKRQNLEKKLEAGEAFAGGDFLLLMDVFPYAPAKPNYIYNQFKKFLRTKCPDLPQLRLHDLRATYASIGAELDFKQNNLKTALGHSDISTTQKFYIKNFNESLQKDVMKLEEAYKRIG